MATAAAIMTPRQRAALPGSSYDRVVGLLKVLLPVAAVAVLATIVILPLTKVQEFSFLLAKDKVAMARERLKLDNAVYRGRTTKDEPFVIRAVGAIQRTSAVPIVELQRMTAELTAKDGPATVVAPSGRYNLETDMLTIAGPVAMQSANGYSLDSQSVDVDLANRTVATDHPVTGKLPMGDFRADSLRGDVAGRTVDLSGHVHLHIFGRGGRGRG